jgi:hypothetical protein
MNSHGRYQEQYNEAIQEDAEGLNAFLQIERKKALNSYPKGVDVVYCDICGEPLVYNSMSYHEGYHFDSCI